MQTPVMTDGQVVKAAQMALIVAAIRAWQKLVLDLLLAQLNTVVPGGFALSANPGTPIQVNDAGGALVLSGYDIALSPGSFTFGAADATNHRYDLMTVAYSQASGTDSSGAPTLVDTGTRTVVAGVASGSPTVPATPAGSVTVGWLDIPPGATSATTCTIHPVQGPLVPNNLQDLTNHIAAAITSGTAVHGIKQGAGNGFDADTVDGSHASAFDAAGTASDQVASEASTRAAADTAEATARAGVQTNLTNHAAQSIYTGITHGEESRRGHATGISITSGMGDVLVATITFSPAMAGTPQSISLTLDAPNPGGAPPYAPPGAVTASGFQIWMSTAGTYTGGVYWRADS